MATLASIDTIVGVFENQHDAQRFVTELRRSGYREGQIGVVSQQREQSVLPQDSGTKVEEGAVAGLATGAGLGALWGLGILSNVVPGIGPAIVGGTLGVILSSAATGAAAAGIGGALAGMGISDDNARYYEGEVNEGRTIVTISGEGDAERIRQMVADFGGYDRAEL